MASFSSPRVSLSISLKKVKISSTQINGCKQDSHRNQRRWWRRKSDSTSFISFSFSITILRSSLSLQEFDWEAAVREIDTACQSSKPSTSNSTNFNLCSKANKKPSTSKQSTLDKFFGNVGPKPQGTEEFNEGSSFDESLCHVQIDAEAAKTWIYPG